MTFDEGAIFYDEAAEQAVLGSILVNSSVIDELSLNHNDYYKTAHKYIVRAIQHLISADEVIDVITISSWLAGRKLLDEAGGLHYLTELGASVPSEKNAKFYEKLVKEKAKRRTIQKALKRMQEKLSEVTEEELDSMINKGIDVINNANGVKEEGFKHLKDVAVEVFEEAEIERGDMVGVPTGYKELDDILGGLKGTELITIGARPGAGKTAFALNVAMNTAGAGALVPVYSMEMKSIALGQRIMSRETRINSRKLKIGRSHLSSDDWQRMILALGSMSNVDVLISDSNNVRVSKIKKDLARLRKENPNRPIICIIDYLQLIQGDKQRTGNRQEEVSDIVRTLKTTALDNDVCIIALSQLSRNVEQRQDKRPMLSDLRESGSIEQDSDAVAFLYRDDYYNADSEHKNILECIVAKQRDGSVGTVQLFFEKEIGNIAELEHRRG